MADSNFSFLAGHWAFLIQDAQQAEKYALQDPRASAIYARRTLELALKWLYENDSALKSPYEQSLAAMIHEKTFAQSIKKGLFTDIKAIHRLGNIAAHEHTPISSKEGMALAGALHRFLGWLTRVYTRGGATPGQFQASLLPKEEAPALTTAQIESLQEAAKEKDEKLSQTEEELAALKAQLAELQAIKEANEATIGSEEYSEATTRELIIDVMLRESGWDPKAQNVEEYPVVGMPTDKGEGYVDYVLWSDDGKPIGLVEAKRTAVDPKVGKQQAKLYADCLEQMHGHRPIIYYSNGYQTWVWDDEFYPPRETYGFATRDELQWRIRQRAERQDLTAMKPKPEITGRAYQQEAAQRVMEAYGQQRTRKALIAMATGTGKTRLAISLVDMLLRAGWARRVLFLADRIALVNQAKREFNRHLPNVTVASLLDSKADPNARVIFSTYPTMLNCIDGTKKDQKGAFSVAHFDLVIIDEAHRSVYQKFGAIFDYFDSLLLGLTATPRSEVDRNTYRLFELDNYQPTYAYELDEAVKDGFLVPPKALSVPLMFQREGIKYHDLSPEEQEEYEAQESFYDPDTGLMREEIGSAALNQWLFNTDTVDQVLMHLMESGLKVEGGDKLGKTIVFAKNSKHADFIVTRFDKNYPHLKGQFCQKIDYSVKYAQSLIDDFSLVEKYPQIAVSVDMLDTGIDVPEVVNLVFFKMVRSRVKFWQMVGRGARLCENLFGPGQDKEMFFLFDYCQNLEFFDANPEGFESRPQPSLKQRIFLQRLAVKQLGAASEADGAVDLSSVVTDQLHGTVAGMDVDNFIVRKARKDVETFQNRKRWDALSEDDVSLLSERVSALPTADEDDESARRFDLLVLNLQHAILTNDQSQVRYRNAIKEVSANLEDKKAIPSVAAQMELILELQTDPYWESVTVLMLEEVRKKLRDLCRFIEPKAGQEDVFTHFEDLLLAEDAAEYNIVQADPNLKDYRKRVQRFIREHQDHVTIRRLKNNEPVSAKDLEALESILFSEGGPIPHDEFERIYGTETPLGVLVRSITGLSQKAANEAFAEFLNSTNLTADQMTFVKEVVDYVIKNGTMEPKVLFETPFSNYHDQGVVGVFGDRAQDVVEVVKAINRNAEVA